MKSQTFAYFIFMVLIIKLTNAQVKPIVTSIDGDYTIYKTSLYDQYSDTLENQSYRLKMKLEKSYTKAEYRNNNAFPKDFFQLNLSKTNHRILKNNRSKQSRFYIKYIIDQTGDSVYSCSLQYPMNLLTLTSTEIEAILTEAMNHKFDYINEPIEDFDFYYKITYTIII